MSVCVHIWQRLKVLVSFNMCAFGDVSRHLPSLSLSLSLSHTHRHKLPKYRPAFLLSVTKARVRVSVASLRCIRHFYVTACRCLQPASEIWHRFVERRCIRALLRYHWLPSCSLVFRLKWSLLLNVSVSSFRHVVRPECVRTPAKHVRTITKAKTL
jgi:hypothetical protein